MSTQSLTTQQSREMQQWSSTTHVKSRIEAIQQLMKNVLKAGTKENDYSGDYGIVPGTKKPSLWKSGSEQILAMFQIAVEPVVEDLSSDDCYRYRVTTRLTNAQTGEFLGAGIGEASTDETKYKWRRTYSKKEFDATDPDRRRMKYSQYKNQGSWVDSEEMQVRQEPADLANTVLKMAKKRSQIDATLTVTGASSMFEQDLEDLPEETQRELVSQRNKSASKPASTDVVCSDCGKTNGHEASCKYAKQCPECHGPAGKHATTCSRKQSVPTATASPEPEKPVETTPEPSETQTAVELKPGQEKMLLRVLDVQPWTKGTLSKMNVRVEDNEMNEFEISCWHKSLTDKLNTAKGELCAFVVEKKAKGGRDYYNIEQILAIGATEFQAVSE